MNTLISIQFIVVALVTVAIIVSLAWISIRRRKWRELRVREFIQLANQYRLEYKPIEESLMRRLDSARYKRNIITGTYKDHLVSIADIYNLGLNSITAHYIGTEIMCDGKDIHPKEYLYDHIRPDQIFVEVDSYIESIKNK